MAERLPRRWEPRYQGLSRRDRLGGSYDAYLPDPLMGWQLRLPGDLAADVADAEREVLALQTDEDHHGSLEGMARFLLRAESVSSSHIEGVSAAARRLARVEVELKVSPDTRDRAAAAILGNIRAMERAVTEAASIDGFTAEEILELHRLIMLASDTPDDAGSLRSEQNWIGGSSYNPCSADFVPPPPEQVPPLLEDLVQYIEGDAHSPIVQAALAHAQFETIHPFADGNGRVGRALIHVVLKRQCLATKFVPPVSLVLATWNEDYISGLTRFRHDSPPDSEERTVAATDWIRTFTIAVRRACLDARRYSNEISGMNSEWREACGRIKKNSATDRLLRALPGTPVVTVESAAKLIDRSRARTGDAVNALVDAGVLVQRNVGRQRYRVFEAPRVLDLFTGLERTLASPTGDTYEAAPVRRVPERPSR